MKQFHPLTIERIENETSDSVRIALAVPAGYESDYEFLAGQHLPFEITIDGRKLRRTYSICSGVDERPLEIGIRVQPGGAFSEYADSQLSVGDTLDAMPPAGHFHIEPEKGNARDYLGFAAGSGITPILSMMKSVLETEPYSRFVLFYGNRKQATTMFIEDLYGEKVRELYEHFCTGLEPAEAFVCGPDTMIQNVTETLVELGMDADHVHSERFGLPREVEKARPAPAEEAAEHATVTIIMDGHKKSFEMRRGDDNIVDATDDNGIDLPYSCKGGVCATCRCHVREGEVTMATNYGLEPWEVEAGYVLACQSRPVSESILLDYDKT